MNKETTKTRCNSAKPEKRTYSWHLTAALMAVFVLGFLVLWALFVSGPARVHEHEQQQVIAHMEEIAPGIENLEETFFAFPTWQGNTADTLYWFDANGDVITTRELSSLDYEAARKKALEDFGMDAASVQLGYGYNAPVYLLRNGDNVLMLDYDSLEWVYERGENS